MDYTLRYSSTRAEIWKWYWRRWRKRLWPVHVAGAAMVGFMLSGSHIGAIQAVPWLAYSLVVFPFVVVGFASIPQLAFKSQERTLEVGPNGWSTRIGNKSGSRTWAQVAAVDEQDGKIVIRGTNGNALIVPGRAFVSDAERQQFVRDVNVWRTQ